MTIPCLKLSEKRAVEGPKREVKLGGMRSLCHRRQGVQCVRFPVARYTTPSVPAEGFIHDPGWLGSKFDA